MSRSTLAPLAVLLGASLHGCSFNDLPSAVQIELGHQCLEKSEDSVKDLLDSEKTLGEKQGCDDLDQDKLAAFQVDCEKAQAMIVGWAAEFECEVQVADDVVKACEEATEDCKSAVDESVGAWELSKPDVDESEEEEEEKEGFEGLLAVTSECHKEATKHFDSNKEPVETACADENKDALKVMGVSQEKCKEYRTKQLVDFTAIICTGYVLLNLPPEGEPTLDDIQGVVTSFFEKDENAIEGSDGNGDRLRLYAQAAIKSKSWPKLHTWSTKMAKFGGASVAALAVLVILGMRRRSTQRVEAQDEQQLMNIE